MGEPWGVRWGLGAVVRVGACVCEGKETGGQRVFRTFFCCIRGETEHCKIKSLKRSSKLTDKQTSGTNSSNTDVQVKKRKNKERK